MCHIVPDYRTFIDDYLKIVEFIEWLKDIYPEKVKFLEGVDEASQSPYVNIILAMAKPNLDSARRRYMASVENGKKGSEFGKLGGAPKGNQHARKKQPQKQPLDVDANEDVDVNEDEEVYVNGYDDGDNPSGSIGFQEEEIENDSERLEERGENNERNLGFDFKGFEFVAASEEEKESYINSKSESNNTLPVSPCSEREAGCSAARSSQGKDAGMDAGKYSTSHCIQKNRQPLNCDRRFCYHITQRIICLGVGF